jgi:Ca2+-binding RTX toxin-like protein
MTGFFGFDDMLGNQGADTFITFGDAGTDRVTDFNRARGDGATMTLAGVSFASLSGDWIAAA